MGQHASKETLKLAIPAIITNITTPLLGLVDVALTGHMGGAVYLAAIAVGGTMFNLLYWLFGFLRMSASGLTAQAFGRDDIKTQTVLLWRELAVALTFGLLIVAAGPWIGSLLLRLVDADADAALMARRYFNILVWGAPAVLCTYALTGWYLGRQNSRIAMWVSFLINISNIAVSVTLVYSFKMKIEGVAIGSLAAQWIGVAALAAGLLRCRLPRIPIRELLDLNGLGQLFNVSSTLMLRTVCMLAVTFWFTHVGAAQGSVVLAVNALLMQLFLLFSYVMDGFAFAAEAMVGKYIGAASADGLRKAVRSVMTWSLWLAVAFTVVYVCAGETVLGWLSDDEHVRLASMEYAAWSFAIPLAGFAAFAWDGVYIGAVANKMMLASLAFSAAVFFLLYFLLFPIIHNHGLWVAFIGYLAARSLFQSLAWPSISRRLTKVA